MKYFYILILFLTFTVRSDAQSVSSKFFTTLPKEVELQTGPLAKSLDSSAIELNYNRPQPIIKNIAKKRIILTTLQFYQIYCKMP